MSDYICSECEEPFEDDFSYGRDVQCPECKVWLETDTEYDWDNCYVWVVGKSENQNQES